MMRNFFFPTQSSVDGFSSSYRNVRCKEIEHKFMSSFCEIDWAMCASPWVAAYQPPDMENHRGEIAVGAAARRVKRGPRGDIAGMRNQ
jgi:hypothetical protein